MRSTPRPNLSRLRLLKGVVKLMFFSMLAALGLVMLRPLLPEAEPPPPPLRVNVAPLAVGAMQGLEWNRQRLLVVHPAAGEYLVIADYDPLYGCPLVWVGADAPEAPHQPWPGGLRAICTAHWFDATGAALSAGVADLKPLPFVLEAPATLVISSPQ